jgi:hypothetical protein
MSNKNLITSFVVFSIIFSSSVFAFNIPCAFFGTAKLDNTPINGTLVTAHLNSTGELLATAEEVSGLGSYSVVIDSTGNYVKFKIAGIWVNEPEQLCTSGGHTYLNLTASTLSDGSPCTSDASCNSTFCVHGTCRPTNPYIGDGFCDSGENCLNSPIDCACPSGQNCGSDGVCHTPQQPSVGGGSSFVGGGAPPVCKEDWTCTEWSGCVADQQTRTCTDKNNCNTNKTKPNITQACTVMSCTENWSCTDWSACSPSGTQARTCTDSSNCGTTTNKPTESQSCVYEAVTTNSQTPPTGLFLGLTTNDWVIGTVIGILIAIIIIFLSIRKKKRK